MENEQQSPEITEITERLTGTEIDGFLLEAVLGSGSSLADQAKGVFKSRLLDGNAVAAVAKQFGIAEGAVDGLVQQGVAAVRDQFLKLV